MTEPLVKLSGLSKRYGEFTAVAGLDLDVMRGEVFALLGPNGAGKTTTIRMLMGILQPSAGSATVDGLDAFADRAEVKRRVGYLPDEPVFYDYLRGREIVRFVGQMHGLADALIDERSAPLFRNLAIEDALEEYAVNYSHGMKKKLALVCALLHDPELLILDEPTNGLDPFATRTVHQLVRQKTAEGKSVFFSTHLLDQAEKLCTRVGILNKGRLAAVGRLDELRAGAANNATLEEIFFAVMQDAPEPPAATPTPPAPPGAPA